MSPEDFLTRVLDDGLDFLASLGGPKPTDAARQFLLAVALQESGPKLDARYQGSPATSPGPARGWWQFEQGGGVAGVLNHSASKTLAIAVTGALTIVTSPSAVWRSLEGNDLLSASFARLLVWTDPQPLPTTENAGWSCYNDRLWRPGRPHRDAWHINWQTASETIQSTPLA